MLELKAELRQEFGRKTNKARKTGQIPAVIYGHGIKSEPLYVSANEFGKVYKAAGASTMVSLDLDGKNRNVLIHDIARNPLSGEVLHIDFYQVRMDEKIKAKVPLVFIGESEAVKSEGGILVKNIQEIEVEALPADLPHHFDVNIEKLKTFEDHIYVGDLEISDKVKVSADQKEIIALVTPPRSEEELAALEQKVEAPVEEVKVVGEEEKVAEEAVAAEEMKEMKEK